MDTGFSDNLGGIADSKLCYCKGLKKYWQQCTRIEIPGRYCWQHKEYEEKNLVIRKLTVELPLGADVKCIGKIVEENELVDLEIITDHSSPTNINKLFQMPSLRSLRIQGTDNGLFFVTRFSKDSRLVLFDIGHITLNDPRIHQYVPEIPTLLHLIINYNNRDFYTDETLAQNDTITSLICVETRDGLPDIIHPECEPNIVKINRIVDSVLTRVLKHLFWHN